MKRPPVGIIVIAFFALMAGLANLVVGVRITGWVVFGPGDFGNGSFLWGLLTLGIGIAYLAAAAALWAKRSWAWPSPSCSPSLRCWMPCSSRSAPAA